MGVIDSSLDQVSFSYGDKSYQVTQRAGNDFESTTISGLNGTGFARDVIKVFKSAIGAAKTFFEIEEGALIDIYASMGAYMNFSSIPRAPVAILEAKNKLVHLNHKDVKALDTYEVAKALSAVLDASVMSCFALDCFKALSPNGLGIVKRLGLAHDSIDLMTYAADWHYYTKMCAEMSRNTGEGMGSEEVLDAIATERRFAAIKVAKTTVCLLGLPVGARASSLMARSMGLAARPLLIGAACLGVIEGIANITAYYVRNQSSYKLQEVRPSRAV